MPISRLTSVVQPPASPIATEESRWKAVERQLKVELPMDYLDYSKAYGSGQFSIGNKDAIRMLNPLDENYLAVVQERMKMFKEYRRDNGKEDFKYNVFPKRPGVLPVGDSEQAFNIFYLIPKGAGDWPIVVQGGDDSEFYQYGSLTGFLADLFSGNNGVEPWKNGYFAGEIVTFEPKAIPAPPPPLEYKTIDALYSDNGDKAGFWMQSPTMELEGKIYFVKSIAGQTNGKLAHVSFKTVQPPVIVDRYQNGKLITRDYNLGRDARFVFAMMPAPQLES